ncbi:MAG: CopG family transcriptional regulator [Acidobacteria bacterium]|nr:MAG: CopG family transcriptional regulator [Acidobacteriota bacterium]
MSQITLYLEEETAQQLKAAAGAAGQSVSRWVADLIRQKIATEWPGNVINLAGAWPDLQTTEQLRAAEPEDTPREFL